jgi:hypothetical protein
VAVDCEPYSSSLHAWHPAVFTNYFFTLILPFSVGKENKVAVVLGRRIDAFNFLILI